MSVEAQSWAFATKHLSKQRSACKFVLVALADHADGRGACYPSLSHLEEKCEMSRNFLRDRIDELVATGFIYRAERRRDDGSRTTNEYVLLMNEAARAYAMELGWDPSCVPAPACADAAPRRGRANFRDERQIELFGALELGGSESTPPSTQQGRGPSIQRGRGPSTQQGRHEPSYEPSYEPTPIAPERPPPELGDGMGSEPGDSGERDLWLELLEAYPFDVLDRREPAREVWSRLSGEERAAAVRCASRYATETRDRGRKLVSLERWLREKGWEPFLEAEARRAATQQSPIEQVWIRQGSEEAAAWARHQGVKKLFVFHSPHHGSHGAYKPSRWPPGHTLGPADDQTCEIARSDPSRPAASSGYEIFKGVAPDAR